MQPIVVTGLAQEVDSFIRPIVRFVQMVVGITGSLVVWWMGWMWWVPVPFVLSLLAYTFFFWSRGDRPQTLKLDERGLILHDELRDAIAVPYDRVTNATLFYRPVKDELELVVVLGDDHDVLFAVRTLTRCAFEPGRYDISADAYDVLFGGVAGIFRALAPVDKRPRQTFVDREGRVVACLRERLDPRVWSRTGLRLWTGMEPEMNLFGYYEAVHDDWMVLDGHGWRRRQSEGQIPGWTLGQAERSAVLFQGLADKMTVERLVMVLAHLGPSTTVGIPAPSADGIGEIEPLSSDILHTHPPEGAALTWHLLMHTPPDRWPAELDAMIHERRAIREHISAELPR